ncbi:MAG: hypothetical protein Q8K58_01425 [Acidimicrobiales bacterium]|nr:hypothetical protein [Acidimicrobiales bacterium]
MLQALRSSRATAYVAGLLPVARPARFLVLCQPRSGSELFVELLNGLPGVVCVSEPLRSPAWSLGAVLEGWARRARLRGARAWGCKLLIQDLLWHEGRYGPGADVLRSLVDRGWTIVHLQRRDPLSGALSALHADTTGRWHQREHEDVSFTPMTPDVATVLAWLHTMDLQQRWLDAALASVPYLEVDYHDDLLSPGARRALVDRISAALGVPSAPVSSTLRAVAPRDPWQRVDDPEPLRVALRQTRFAHLVPDDPDDPD